MVDLEIFFGKNLTLQRKFKYTKIFYSRTHEHMHSHMYIDIVYGRVWKLAYSDGTTLLEAQLHYCEEGDNSSMTRMCDREQLHLYST